MTEPRPLYYLAPNVIRFAPRMSARVDGGPPPSLKDPDLVSPASTGTANVLAFPAKTTATPIDADALPSP